MAREIEYREEFQNIKARGVGWARVKCFLKVEHGLSASSYVDDSTTWIHFFSYGYD